MKLVNASAAASPVLPARWAAEDAILQNWLMPSPLRQLQISPAGMSTRDAAWKMSQGAPYVSATERSPALWQRSVKYP